TSMSVMNLYLGHRLGLWRSMVDAGPVTSGQLASRTGYDERYLREWLDAMTVNGYIEHEEGTGAFSVPSEHAAALTDRDNPAFVAPFLCWLPGLAGVLKPLRGAFKTGGGVPYEAYGTHTLEAIGTGNRSMFVNDYVSSWIPALPDVEAKLQEGARVADIGCGLGWSSISLAKGFPASAIDAYDLDVASIEKAEALAEQEGVEERVRFHVAAAEDIVTLNKYDLVTAFEVIHDMAYPVEALKRMREMLAPGGVVLIADEAVGDTLEENSDFYGRFMYNFSVLHCLPQAKVFQNSAETGTVMGPAKLREYAERAGFSKVEVLPIENDFWRFYRLEP
ncbi:MAG: methyltransferase domain-containing protein, partial [Thermoplasmata archaeon]